MIKSIAKAVLIGSVMVVFPASAEFMLDKTVMSQKYWDIWNDEVLSRIDADIEKYRKADAVFEIAAPTGTEVKVEQLTHGFFFGAHTFNFNQLGTHERNLRYRALFDAEKGLFNSGTVAFYWRTLEKYPYAPRFAESYEDTENFWNLCPDPANQDHWRRPAPDPVISHLKAFGCRIHGHPLVWGNNDWHFPHWLWDDFAPESEKLALECATGVKFPRRNLELGMGVKDHARAVAWERAWAKVCAKLDEQQLYALVPTYADAVKNFTARRIREIAERYGNRVDSWDVVNESASDWYFNSLRKWPEGESPAVNKASLTKSHYGLMPPNYAYEALSLARKYMASGAWLNINDFDMEHLPGQVADLIKHGAEIDVVGSQMHLFNPRESAAIAAGTHGRDTQWKINPNAISNTFARLTEAGGGRPIHLSEITITAPDKTPQGEMIQAVIMYNCYRAWFAVEKMCGITWWNVVDDCGAPGEPSMSGLFTRDMQPKAAYYAMDQLINHEWKTSLTVKAERTTEGKAEVRFRGFRGKYRLTWKDAGGKTKSAEFVLK